MHGVEICYIAVLEHVNVLWQSRNLIGNRASSDHQFGGGGRGCGIEEG